jgi:DNA-binding protein H-NS
LRNNNKKIEGVKQLIEKFKYVTEEPNDEQKTKISSLQARIDDGKKIEKEIKDFHKSVKDAEAKLKAQKREQEKLVDQGRREGVQAIANMIAVHTF